MDAQLDCARIADRFGGEVKDAGRGLDMPVLEVTPARLVDLCRYLKEDPELKFDFLSDICGVDYHPEEPRYATVYHLYSLPFKWRLRLRCRLADPPRVPTVTGLWRTANWHEREAYDMYGIVFDDHPDLRRIYMWEEFDGYPMRKDFPLRGYKDDYNPFGEEGPATPPAPLTTKDW